MTKTKKVSYRFSIIYEFVTRVPVNEYFSYFIATVICQTSSRGLVRLHPSPLRSAQFLSVHCSTQQINPHG